jgi:hypothetical protein
MNNLLVGLGLGALSATVAQNGFLSKFNGLRSSTHELDLWNERSPRCTARLIRAYRAVQNDLLALYSHSMRYKKTVWELAEESGEDPKFFRRELNRAESTSRAVRRRCNL